MNKINVFMKIALIVNKLVRKIILQWMALPLLRCPYDFKSLKYQLIKLRTII